MSIKDDRKIKHIVKRWIDIFALSLVVFLLCLAIELRIGKLGNWVKSFVLEKGVFVAILVVFFGLAAIWTLLWRLSRAGDFNIDIAREALREGENKVLIKAVDKQGGISTETVVVNYTKDKVWQLPYKIEWGRVADIGDVAEIVDGKWVITSDGVRIGEAGYDRLIAIGDLNWTDYEITVPITIHKVDTQTGPVSGGPAVGILMRWTGHTDNPRAGWQPKAGWIPNGAIGWWRGEKGKGLSRLEFYVTGGQRSFEPKLGVRYMFKMRVKSVYGRGGMYKLKVWEDGQSEPAKWSLTFGANASNPGYGSLLLIAHHVEATYGDIVVKKVQ